MFEQSVSFSQIAMTVLPFCNSLFDTVSIYEYFCALSEFRDSRLPMNE